MTQRNPHVKPTSRQIADWIDDHPRTGWYVAFWAALVSLNVVVDWFDRILHAIA